MSHISIGCAFKTSGPTAIRRSDPQDAGSSAAAAEAAVSADITAALANVTIAGNGTALGLVQQIQTDFATLTAALAAGGSTTSPVLVSYDPAVVLSKNTLMGCLLEIMQRVKGAKDLA